MELFDTSLEFLINSAQTMTFYDVAEITENQHCTGNVLQSLFMLFFFLQVKSKCIHPQYPDKSYFAWKLYFFSSKHGYFSFKSILLNFFSYFF